MVHFGQNRAIDIFLYILLYELKALHRLVYFLLTKIFHPKIMTSKVTPMNLMKPRSVTYLFHLSWSLLVFEADTSHYTCLQFYMIFLRSITNTSPNLKENPKTSLLRNIYKLLNISLTFLKYNMMMFA